MIQFAIILFFLTYALMLVFSNYKHCIAFISACIFVLFGILPVEKILDSIDFNVLLMILGTMGTVSLFIESKMPNMLSDLIILKTKNVKWMTLALALFSGVISAFVDNVATVLMIAPVTIAVAKKLKVSPVPIILAVSIFSNLEGAATLVGDTTSILLAGAMKLNFMDFFFYEGKMGLFFIVQLGLIAALLVLYFLMRKHNRKIEKGSVEKISDYAPTVLLVLTVVSLIVASFIDKKPELINGYICMFYFIVGIIIKIIKTKSFSSIFNNLKEIDYQTLLLLASLFVIIGGVKEVGAIDYIGKVFMNIGSSSPFVMYTLIVFVSVLVSAFIDNIPYVATMLPVVLSISLGTGINPTILYYGLIVGSTLGGNITPIGASANIAAIGILNKNGYSVSNKEYFKMSVPISLAAILTGYILILLLFPF
ncbi:MAG: arsenic transporter [Bacilli bacterium]|nr:arsenic transporter [Bacilli bacterium]